VTDLPEIDVSNCYRPCVPPVVCVVGDCPVMTDRASIWFLHLGDKRVTCWLPMCEEHLPRIEDEFSDSE